MPQTIYRSWKVRRKRLEHAPASMDTVICKDEMAILDDLIARHRHSESATHRTRFPAIVLAPPKLAVAGKPRSRLFAWCHGWEERASAGVRPILDDIAELDPQESMRENARLEALGAPAAVAPRSSMNALLHADLGELFTNAFRGASDGIGAMLFEEIHPLRALWKLARLIGSYFSGMLDLLFRTDRRNAAEYIVDGLREHGNGAELGASASASSAGAELRVAPTAQHDRLYLDRRAILIHEYARSEKVRAARLKPDDASNMVRVAQRFIQRRAKSLRNAQPAPPRQKGGSGEWLDRYAHRVFDGHGKSIDAFASSLDQRMLPGEAVTKACYLNLVCLARAMRIVAGHATGRWLSDAAESSDEHLFDEAAELLSDPAAREWSLQRFRLDLASGDPALRFTAIEMLARLGTLDDIGLLLDLTLLTPSGPGALRERRHMLRAARRLAAGSLF